MWRSTADFDGPRTLDQMTILRARPPERARALVQSSLAIGEARTRVELRGGRRATQRSGLAGTLARRGVGRGDVVMTLIGNRPEWVLAMIACFRLGAVVLPCTEQLRAKDLRLRLRWPSER